MDAHEKNDLATNEVTTHDNMVLSSYSTKRMR